MEFAKYQGTYVYGLDIGTRSIVGTVGYKVKDHFVVVAQYAKEHETRAMLDGQIHDIGAVGETIQKVTKYLEEQIGQPLKEVCIAAAGRVLRTVTTHVETEFEHETEISREDIYALDSQGVEKAYETFQTENDSKLHFYCVGYSVMKYYLNGYPIGNLENHKAQTIGEDIIVTFLPDDVVDGLYKAVEIAGLEVANLTLEPIAAIELAIPERYRMLNIALIDVGAGTSDISITKDGSIVAYGMLPIAGDCLTEDIAKECLVDFATAEEIKRGISNADSVEYKDIMGLPQTITKAEVLKTVETSMDSMAKMAADKIKELNGDKSVSAVFVVGGGGRLEGYTDKVAEYLGIAKERCAVRGEEVMQNIDFMQPDVEKTSLLVTPIGICLNYYEQSNNFIFVSFNNMRVKLYDNSKLAVIDAAMQADFPNEDLFPKCGESLNFRFNGVMRAVRGKRGESATIMVNGVEADIHTPIHANDVITVTKSTAGDKASMSIGQLPEYHATVSIVVNDKNIKLPKFATVNGALQSEFYDIKQGDEIRLLDYYTVGQIAEFMDVILEPAMNIYVNNKRANLDTKVYEQFSVIWTLENLKLSDAELDEEAAEERAVYPESYEELREDEEVQHDPVQDETNVSENSQAKNEDDAGEKQPESSTITVIVNKSPVTLSGKPDYIFVDVFDHIDFDLSKPQGSSVETLLNGNKAQYIEPLKDGDVLDIFWKD